MENSVERIIKKYFKAEIAEKTRNNIFGDRRTYRRDSRLLCNTNCFFYQDQITVVKNLCSWLIARDL